MNETVPKRKGKIITFYSFKGGTGRTMALANVAWILASSNRRVLAVDWDLEAPGLHHYFSPYIEDRDLISSRGVIDLATDYAFEAVTAKGPTPDESWFRERAAFSTYLTRVNFDFNAEGRLDLLPAGRQDSAYGSRINSFDWQRFYNRLGGGSFIDALRERMLEKYDYVLVDSRTGVSDTAGICTIQIPDILVLCLTMNRQNIQGASAAVGTILKQRENRGKDGKFLFPVLMRINRDLPPESVITQNNRRIEVWKQLERLMGAIDKDQWEGYKSSVEVPYRASLEQYEVLATLVEDLKTGSALDAYVSLAEYLAGSDQIEFLAPTQEQKTEGLQGFTDAAGIEVSIAAALPEPEEVAVRRKADELFHGLPEDERSKFLSICTRLTRISPESEGGQNTRVRIRISDLGDSLKPLAEAAAAGHRLLEKSSDDKDIPFIQFANESLVRWRPLVERIESSRKFLEWRQRLDSLISEWDISDRKDDTLLPRSHSLLEAKKYLESPPYPHDVNLRESEFIKRAIKRERHRQIATRGLIIVAVLLMALLIYSLAKERHEAARRNDREIAVQLNLAGTQHLGAGELDNAIRDFDGAVRRDPDLVDAYLNRGLAHLRSGSQLAISDFTTVLEHQPGNKDVLDLRGQAYDAANEFDSAVADWNQAIAKDPNDVEAYNHLGDAYRRRGKYEESENNLNKAIDRKSRFAEAWLNRGKLKYDRGDYDGAEKDLSEAIDNKAGRENQLDLAQLADAFITRGHCYLKLDKYPQALNDYSTAKKVDPHNPMAFYYEAEAYATKGYLEAHGATQDYDEAIKLDDKNPDFYYARGYLNYMLALGSKYPGKYYEMARGDFSQAINFRPGFSQAFALRSDCNWKMGKRDEAVADYKRAVEFGVSEPFAVEVLKRLESLTRKKGQLATPQRKRLRQPNSR